jgi:hypothetical protein
MGQHTNLLGLGASLSCVNDWITSLSSLVGKSGGFSKPVIWMPQAALIPITVPSWHAWR